MTLLKTMDYAAGTMVPPWEDVSNPRRRGTRVTRVEALAGAAVPGDPADPNRPATAAHYWLEPFHQGDVKITLAADVSASATSLPLIPGDGLKLFGLDFAEADNTAERMRVLGVEGVPITTDLVPVGRAEKGGAVAQSLKAGQTLTVPGGDVNDSGLDAGSPGHFMSSRVEVLDGLPAGASTKPADQWPYPIGSPLWVRGSFYMEPGFIGQSAYWMDIFQFKGQNGGSPPIALEFSGNNLILGGTRSHKRPRLGVTVGASYSARVRATPGRWMRYVIGVRLSPDPSTGYVNFWVNGVELLRRTATDTMDIRADGVTVDPVYIKQGIYRDKRWPLRVDVTHGPLEIATSAADFGIAPSPAIVRGTEAGPWWGVRGR